ncbi:MAG: hypothetical protein WC307_06385 [Candidatus Nanoarchaeia archaeon]|jgi:hypothetical protein
MWTFNPFTGTLDYYKIDPHNLGYYATEAALTTVHPTASDGDWAIVGSTDTVWVWDTDTNAWVDTDTKGQVSSVFGRSGIVTAQSGDYSLSQISGTTAITLDYAFDNGKIINGADSLINAFKVGNGINYTALSICDDIVGSIPQFYFNTNGIIRCGEVDGTIIFCAGDINQASTMQIVIPAWNAGNTDNKSLLFKSDYSNNEGNIIFNGTTLKIYSYGSIILDDGTNSVSVANCKTAYTHSGLTTGNPHSVTLSDVGGESPLTFSYPLNRSTNTISLLYDNSTIKVNGSNQIYVYGYNNTNWDTAYGWGNHASAGYFVGIDSTIRALFSSTATGLTYTNTTGIFSLTSGYVIPTTTEETNWGTAYSNRVDTWTSPLSFSSNTASISQATTSTNGYVSSTDWNTFNGKQTAYTNLSTLGTLANSTGWLYNNGSGTLSYSTPSYNVLSDKPTLLYNLSVGSGAKWYKLGTLTGYGKRVTVRAYGSSGYGNEYAYGTTIAEYDIGNADDEFGGGYYCIGGIASGVSYEWVKNTVATIDCYVALPSYFMGGIEIVPLDGFTVNSTLTTPVSDPSGTNLTNVFYLQSPLTNTSYIAQSNNNSFYQRNTAGTSRNSMIRKVTTDILEIGDATQNTGIKMNEPLEVGSFTKIGSSGNIVLEDTGNYLSFLYAGVNGIKSAGGFNLLVSGSAAAISISSTLNACNFYASSYTFNNGNFSNIGTIGSKAITSSASITGTYLVSNIATGTAPVQVTSTTVCTNLNADLWDGYQFSDYLNQAVKTTSSPTFYGFTSNYYSYFNDSCFINNNTRIYHRNGADTLWFSSLNRTSSNILEIGYASGSGAKFLENVDFDSKEISNVKKVSHSAEYDIGNSGSTKTISANNGMFQKMTLNDNCAITFSDFGVGCFLIKLIQDGTGSRTISFVDTVNYEDGVTPILSIDGGAYDLLFFYYDGSVYNCVPIYSFS